MTKNEKFWCWWMSRYIYYADQRNNKYIFYDIADTLIILSADQIKNLRKQP